MPEALRKTDDQRWKESAVERAEEDDGGTKTRDCRWRFLSFRTQPAVGPGLVVFQSKGEGEVEGVGFWCIFTTCYLFPGSFGVSES